MISASFFPDWANGIAVAAFIIGIISVVEEFFVYFQRTRERILVFKLISDAIKVVQLSLTYAYTGAVLNGVAMIHETDTILQQGVAVLIQYEYFSVRCHIHRHILR